jgi:hypothetical protein
MSFGIAVVVGVRHCSRHDFCVSKAGSFGFLNLMEVLEYFCSEYTAMRQWRGYDARGWDEIGDGQK